MAAGRQLALNRARTAVLARAVVVCGSVPTARGQYLGSGGNGLVERSEGLLGQGYGMGLM